MIRYVFLEAHSFAPSERGASRPGGHAQAFRDLCPTEAGRVYEAPAGVKTVETTALLHLAGVPRETKPFRMTKGHVDGATV